MREYLLVLVVAAAVSYLTTGVVRRFAVRVGAVTAIRDRDVHVVPIPRLGGMAVMLGVTAAVLLATRLPFLSSVDEVATDSRALVAGGLIMFAVGALDDVVELDWLTKLAGSVVAAGVMVVMGVQFYWLPLPGRDTFSLPPMFGAILSALLIVGMAQAVNFVDGLDGLASGVCLIGALAFFVYSYLQAFTGASNRALPAALVMVAIAGACLGFLPHNIHPARIFLGDSGALALGALMGAATVNLTGFQPPAEGRASWLPVLLPLILTIAVLALPTLDLVLAVIRRTAAGRLPFSADRGHLHHRMLDMGHSHRTSVFLLWAWAAVVAFGVVLIGLVGGAWPVITVSIAVVACLVATLVTPVRVRRIRRRRRERIDHRTAA